MSEPETEPVEVIIDSSKETDKAYHFTHPEHGEAFFPKSEVTFKSKLPSGVAIAIIPIWLLDKKGW